MSRLRHEIHFTCPSALSVNWIYRDSINKGRRVGAGRGVWGGVGG